MAFLAASVQQLGHVVYAVAFSLRVEIACLCSVAALWLGTRVLDSSRLSDLRKKSGDVGGQRPSGTCGTGIASRSRPSSPLGDERVPAEDLCADPSRLTDASWVVPRIIQLCRAHIVKGVHVFHCAMQAGLDLRKMPAADCEQMFVSMVTALIRIGHADQALQLLRVLTGRGPGVSTELCASVTRLCTSKQLFEDCLLIFDFLSSETDVMDAQDRSVWSCLLLCSVESRAYHRCAGFFEKLRAAGTPSQRDYWNMVKCGSMTGDWRSMLALVQEMRDNSYEIGSLIYNTVLAGCVAADQTRQARRLLDEMVAIGGVADVVTYNTLIKGYANTGNIDECFECYTLMQEVGIVPSPVTYGILLDSCVNANHVDRAAQVFNSMTAAGCPMNTVLYTTLIKGFARNGKVDEAMSVYEKMQADTSVSPDLITYSIIIKANCDNSRLAEALQLLDAMVKRGLQPDEVIFNTLLVGCSKQANAELARRLYEDMVSSGIPPSNATFSIMIGLYSSCKMFDEAIAMLREEPALHNLEVEPRLFTQLAQCCIRARHGRRAVEAYHLLHEHCVPSAAVHNSIFVLCVKLNMFDTAADILRVAAEKKSRVDAKDVNHVLEGALRKQKVQCVEVCLQAMHSMGLSVDSKLQPRLETILR